MASATLLPKIVVFRLAADGSEQGIYGGLLLHLATVQYRSYLEWIP